MLVNSNRKFLALTTFSMEGKFHVISQTRKSLEETLACVLGGVKPFESPHVDQLSQRIRGAKALSKYLLHGCQKHSTSLGRAQSRRPDSCAIAKVNTLRIHILLLMFLLNPPSPRFLPEASFRYHFHYISFNQLIVYHHITATELSV